MTLPVAEATTIVPSAASSGSDDQPFTVTGQPGPVDPSARSIVYTVSSGSPHCSGDVAAAGHPDPPLGVDLHPGFAFAAGRAGPARDLRAV